jgi:hypothetical protein
MDAEVVPAAGPLRSARANVGEGESGQRDAKTGRERPHGVEGQRTEKLGEVLLVERYEVKASTSSADLVRWARERA